MNKTDLTLLDAFQLSFNSLRARRARPSTVRIYNDAYKTFAATWTSRMKVAEIDREAVDRWLAANANYSPASVNLWIRCLNRTLKLAGSSFRAEQLRAPRPRPNALTEAQLQQLLDHAGRLRPLLLMAAYTGARRSELCLLEWKDMDLEAGEMYLTDAKDATTRTVPLHPELVRVLRPLRDRGGRYVFRAVDCHDRPYVPAALSAAVKRAFYLAGLGDVPRLGLHLLRRTAISRLAAAGVPLPVTMQLVGHREVSTTLRHYTHVSDEARREAVGKLGLTK